MNRFPIAAAFPARVLPLFLVASAYSAESADQLDARVRGMLIGSVVGDAIGGPVEFAGREKVAGLLPRYRDRPDQRVDSADLRRLAEELPLFSYETLRPGVEPYGQWSPEAPAGTVTDDTRHKMVVLDMVRRAVAGERSRPIDRADLARAYLRYADRPEVAATPGWPELSEEGWREFVLASRWVLGEREPTRSSPPSRMWGGLGTCVGQMALPPLAAVFPGDPERAYLVAYELAVFDNGEAKDANSAIVAGLAHALAQPIPTADPAARHAAWTVMADAMKATDPLRYDDVPFDSRELTRRLDQARDLAAKADGRPGRLYRLIEEACPRRHAWEAKFLLVETAALAEFCRGEPLAAIHLAMDFGQDVDSATQLLGAWFGALYGPDLFPAAMRDAIAARLEADYRESLDEWTATLRQAREIDAEAPLFRSIRDPLP